jgi:hypothetical protein
MRHSERATEIYVHVARRDVRLPFILVDPIARYGRLAEETS